MRRIPMLVLALALVLGGVALLLPRWREYATVERLIRIAQTSTQPVREGRWLVLGPQFAGIAEVNRANHVLVEKRGDGLVKLRYGTEGNRGEISDYLSRSSASLPWRAAGAQLEYRRGCVIVSR